MIVRRGCDKRNPPLSEHFARAVVLALQLTGFEPHGQGLALRWLEPGPSRWPGQRFLLPEHGTTKELREPQLRRAVELAKAVPPETFAARSDRRHVALHRFQLGAAEDQPAKALVDYTTTLEALLLPKETTELKFRLRLFGAYFLGATASDRERIFRDLGDVYNARSTIVHGARKPLDGTVLKGATVKARQLAGGMLVKALEDGWPTQRQLEGAALGVT